MFNVGPFLKLAQQTSAISPPSVGASEPPHQLKSLLRPGDLTWILWVFLALALLAFIISLIVAYRRRLAQRKKPIKNEPFINPVTAVLEKILALYPPEEFKNHDDYKNYFFSLSWELRSLIELTLGLYATDMTFAEIKIRLPKVWPYNEKNLAALQDFLSVADLIKFAERPSSPEEAEQYHREVCHLAKLLAGQNRDNQSSHENQSQLEKVGGNP